MYLVRKMLNLSYPDIGREFGRDHTTALHSVNKIESLLQKDDHPLHKTIQDIFLAFSKIMAEKQEEIRRRHTTIARDDYKIEDMMLIIEEAFSAKNKLFLDELFSDAKDMNQVITLFLATLELIKIHRISVQQETIFGTITLRKEWTNE